MMAMMNPAFALVIVLLAPIWIPILILYLRWDKRRRMRLFEENFGTFSLSAARQPQMKTVIEYKDLPPLETKINLVAVIYRYFKLHPKSCKLSANGLTYLVRNKLGDPLLKLSYAAATKYFTEINTSGVMPFAEFVKEKNRGWHIERIPGEFPPPDDKNGVSDFDFSWHIRNHVSKTNKFIAEYFDGKPGCSQVALNKLTEHLSQKFGDGNAASMTRWLKLLRRSGKIDKDYVLLSERNMLMRASACLERYGSDYMDKYFGVVRKQVPVTAGNNRDWYNGATYSRSTAEQYYPYSDSNKKEDENVWGWKRDKPAVERNSNRYQPGTEYYRTERMETPGTPEYEEHLYNDTWLGEETIGGSELKELTGDSSVDTRKEYDVIDAVEEYGLDIHDY